MTVNVRRGSVSRRPYSVTGTTLAELQARIERSGPRDPNDGRRYAGLCSGTFEIGIGRNDLAYEPASGGSGTRLRCRLSGGTVSVDCEINTPRTSSRLSSAAQREWDRFLDAVNTHEDGHVDAYLAEARAIAGELESLTGEGEGRDEAAARRAAQADLVQRITREYARSRLASRADETARRYDARNDHGRSQGAVLDTGIT